MPKSTILYTLICICFLMELSPLSAQDSKPYFIKVSNGFNDIEAIRNFPGVAAINQPFVLKEMQDVYLVELASTQTRQKLKSFLEEKKGLVYIEEVPKYELFYTPNDIDPLQYNLTITNAELAWDLDNNASDKTIAIIDDAIDLQHVDLSANIYANSAEIPANGIDDDNNGFIDDYNGWDFGDGDNNPNPPNANFDHGTHVAGIASARMDNNTGIAAIGANAKILPIKIAQDATGSLVNTYAAVEYAILMQVDVINMSWGGAPYSSTFQTLFNIAYNNNIVCVAAAGNSFTNAPMYPAAYNHVISVASTDVGDLKSVFSNYGPTIDIAAPGSGIYSLVPFSGYGTMSGTSMAAPFVAGLVALMRSSAPAATVDDIEQCLENTCDPVTGSFSNQVGGGRVNAEEALKCIAYPEALFTSLQTQVCPGNTVSFIDSSIGVNLTYNWTFPGGMPATSTLQNPVVTYNTAGTYPVTLQISNGFNTSTITTANYINVGTPTATISGFSSINSGGFGSVVVTFSGNPPYNITISDGTTTTPVSGIMSSPYLHFFNPISTSNYSLTSFSDGQCTGTFSGSATIDVTGGNGVCIDSLSTFIKYLGTNVDDYAMGVSNIEEHGFMIFGRKIISSSSFRNYVCRLDNCGNVIWEKLFQPNTYGIPVSAVMDGNEILLSGYHNSAAQTYLMRLDLNGNIISTKVYGSGATYPRKMIKTTNGELVFGGVTNAAGAGSNDFIVTRTTTTGTVLWQKAYGGSANEFGHNLIEDSNGDLLCIGYSRNYIPGLYKGKITKTDANGTELWTKEYHLGNGITVFDDITDYQNSYYITGRISTGGLGGDDQLVVKTDLTGNVIWSKVLGGAGFDRASGIRIRNDTVYVQGISDAGATSQELTISRMTLNGTLIDYVGLGTNNDDDTFTPGQTLVLGDNQGIYGVGHGDGGYIGGDDILFYKINTFFDICAPLTVTMNEMNVTLTQEVFNATSNTPNWAFNPVTYTSSVVASNQGYICDSLEYSDSNNVICDVLADFDTIVPTCILDSVTFIDMSLDSNDFNLFMYDFGDLTAIHQSSDSIVYHQYLNAGQYTVQLIAVDTITGCTDTVSKTLVITADPVLTLPDTITACLYDTLHIQADPSCISTSAVIDWSPDTDIIIENDYEVTLLPVSSGYIYITVNDNGTIITDSVFIVLDTTCCVSSPQIEFDPVSDFCGTGMLNIINTSVSNSGTPTYNWQFLPNGIPINFVGVTPPVISFAGPGVKQIILEMTDGCGIFQDTFAIYIHEPPVFNAGNGDTLCNSTLIQLGDSSIAGWQYNWSPGQLVSDSTIANPTAFINSSTDFQVVVTDPWTGCSVTDTVSFTFDSVYVNISMNDSVVCIDGLTEVIIPFQSSTAAVLTWSPDALIKTYNSDHIIVELNADNVFTLSATGLTGQCLSSDNVSIDVREKLLPVHIDTLICENETYYYYPLGNWNGNVSGNRIEINQAGDYYFQESNDCNSVQHQITVTTQSCDCFIYVPNAFTPDQNAYNNFFKAEVNCDFLGYYRLDIYNRWGELLYRSFDPSSEWDGTYGGSIVQDGVYVWQITYSETTSSEMHSLRGHVVILK